jgi:hypothetical protein
MRTLIPIAFLFLLFTSCTKYQYLTLSSENTRHNPRNQFVAENDSFRIVYDFYGFDSPLWLSVTNKQPSLLEVDWSRSFIIRGGKPEPLFKPGGALTGELEREASSRSTLINASLVQSSPVEMVPQGATISKEGGKIWPFRKPVNIKRSDMKREKIKVQGFKKKIWKAASAKEMAPINFRIYLTLNPGKERVPVVIDRSFHVSGLVESRVEPQYMPTHGHGNVMVIKGPTRFRKMGFLIAGAILIGGGVIASSTL